MFETNTQNHWWRKQASCNSIFTLWQLAPVCFISDSAESAAVVLCNCDSVIVTFVLYVAISGPLEWTEAWNNISNLYEHQHPSIWLTAGDLQKLLPLETSSTAGDGHPITDALYVCQKKYAWFISIVSQWVKKLLAAKWRSNQYWPAKPWPATGLIITLNH